MNFRATVPYASLHPFVTGTGHTTPHSVLPYYHQHAGYQAYSDQYGQYGMHEADPMSSSSDDLEGFARDFKQRRIKLGYTQVSMK